MHDRWWLTSGSGIRMGTSFNQIGVGKDSEISRLTESEYTSRLDETTSILARQKLGASAQDFTSRLSGCSCSLWLSQQFRDNSGTSIHVYRISDSRLYAHR